MVLRVLLVLLILLDYNYGCIYKKKETSPQHKVNPGVWNDANNERSTDSTCECGKHYHNETGDPRWNLFIGHLKIDPYLGKEVIDPVCVATIITSNLIATVLKCVLTSDNVTLNVYQAWLPDTYSNGLMKRSDIIVSTMSNGEGRRFPVDEIIFGTVTLHQLFVHKDKNKDIHNDLLLLKLNVSGEELLGKTGLRLQPICVPKVYLLDFSSRLGIYYGAGVGQHLGNFSSDYHYGIVDSKRLCDEKEVEGDNSTAQYESLCMRWKTSKEMPPKTFRGGPLYFESVQDGTKFLAGVEYNTSFQYKTTDEKEYMYAYFTNILPMIKYIEHRATQHKSKWCRSKNFVLPKRIPPEPKPDRAEVNETTDIPFEGTELPPTVVDVSWWCAEHQDFMNINTNTDWGRFAEGLNIVKEEVYKCKEINAPEDADILLYEKGQAEPFAKVSQPGKTYKQIKKEWMEKMDYVYASTCVIIFSEGDVEFSWYDYYDEYPEENKVYRININAGEKVNLKWFGLTKQLTYYKECPYLWGRHPPVIFLSGKKEIFRILPYQLCKCNNLDSSRGIPTEIITDFECLELYANKNCTGWIRTVPAGRSIHSENLLVKGSLKLPPTRSFSRCSAKPNCYDKIDVSLFKVVLKNKGVKDWNIQYEVKYLVPEKSVVHPYYLAKKKYFAERDESVLKGTFKMTRFTEVTSRPNNGPYFELEDKSAIGIPHMSKEAISTLLRETSERQIHSQGTDDITYSFDIKENPKTCLYAEMVGYATANFYQTINVANEVEFNFDAMLIIHAKLRSGENLAGDLLKKVVVNDLGYKVEDCDGSHDSCNMDAVFLRKEGKFSLSLSDGKSTKLSNANDCKVDEVTCKSQFAKCECIFGGKRSDSDCK